MFKNLKSAYGAGWRAGNARPGVIEKNGKKYLADPVNPFSPRRFISRELWEIGRLDGIMKRLQS